MNLSILTREYAGDDKIYKATKAILWSHMVNDMKRPTRWYRPTKKGTKVSFDVIHDKPAYLQAMGELRGFMDSVNEEYPEVGLHFDDKDGDD